MKASRTMISFTLITFIIGFMIAIQFQTVQEPLIRDTKDMWELRESVAKEVELHTRLVEEIRLNDNRIYNYETEMAESKEEALKQTLQELKKEVGLTEVKGTGLVITIEPLTEALLIGGQVETISPIILKRFINELNMFGAKHILIDGERLINTTVIRDINGQTKVGSHVLAALPFTIQVITESKETAEKMYNRMQVSPSIEDFFIDNLRVKISRPQSSVVIPAYVDPIRVRNMEPVEDKGEG